MINRRIALATALAAGALVVAGCGMMGSSGAMMGSAMTIPMTGANEVPPNASTGTGTA